MSDSVMPHDDATMTVELIPQASGSDFRLDEDVCATNQTRGFTFSVRIQSNNVHDLRMPAFHGGCRTPSADRLLAK